MTAAAQKLFIAEPALSNYLKKLEEEYDTVLMERDPRSMKPNDAGNILYRKAKLMLELAATAQTASGQYLSMASQKFLDKLVQKGII